jgi:benzoate/toluate 1,2-dioxygenase reductase component
MPAHTIHLRKRHRLADQVYLLRFDRPPGFCFAPGQYIRFSAEGIHRDYTLISPPEGIELEICVRLVPEGRFSPYLIKAPMGQPFTIEGPMGYFQFQSDPPASVFLATGTGVAPFLAFARAGVRGFTLFHGASEPDMLFFSEELRLAAGTYRACVSAATGPQARAPWIGRGRVTELLSTLPPGSYHFYLCGSAEMVHDALGLIDQRFPEAAVFTETFY